MISGTKLETDTYEVPRNSRLLYQYQFYIASDPSLSMDATNIFIREKIKSTAYKTYIQSLANSFLPAMPTIMDMESEDTRSSVAPILSQEVFYNYITKSILTTQLNIKGYILVAIMDGTYTTNPTL